MVLKISTKDLILIMLLKSDLALINIVWLNHLLESTKL